MKVFAILLLSATQAYRPPQGATPWHDETPNYRKPDHKIDYAVPDFGIDHDIISTQKHIEDQEKKHGLWKPKLKDEKKI